MEPISPEEFFSSPDIDGAPGSQIYLFRYLHLLAGRESSGADASALSYAGAKRLASRLQLGSPERLKQLFRNAGLGDLHLEIEPDRLRATVTHANPLPGHPGTTPESTLFAGALTGNTGGCHLERGLIDGALRLITGVDVTSLETSCWTRGDHACVFEAARDMAGGFIEAPGLIAPGMDRRFNAERPVPDGHRQAYGAFLPQGPGAKPFGGTVMGAPALRNWFLDLAVREVARARRHNRELALLYIDLDDLGEVNHHRGRAAGDQIINSVASALSRCCRVEDHLWHHGEDEFAVLLSETGPSSAEAAAQRLISQIRSAAEYVDFSVTVSASIGFSTFPAHADDMAGLFSSARSAVYLAKSIGKGKVQAARKSSAKEAANAPVQHMNLRQEEHMRSPAATDSEPETMPETAERISVLISSASPLLLAGMEQILNQSRSIEIIGSIIDPARLLPTVADLRPDVIFSDVSMAMTDDYALLRLLERDNLPSKTVVSVMDVDQDLIKMAADFRLDGIILQNSSGSEVLGALSNIYQGRTVHPDEVRAAISDLENNRRLLNELSEREVEVLRLVAEGKSNSQISDDLFITVNTVRFHLANIYQKLTVANRTEAANYYLRQDLAQESQPKFFE